jgi:hypothetical protein
MKRTTTLCLALLLVSGGTAAADDVASTDKVPPVAAAKPADSSDAKVAAEDGQGKDAQQKDAQQKETPKGDGGGDKVAAKAGGDVKMSGMSILGNEEAPKSLVIVPWKSSQMGDMPSVSRLLDSSTQPVDKDVFMRELAYYEIRANAH